MHVTPENPPACYKIADLVLDTGSRRVTRGREVLSVGGLTFDLLHALAESSPSMLSYDELADRVWNGRPVSPETIAQRAKMLRDALSDDAKSPRYLELVRGQGYRLATDARVIDRDSQRKTRWRPAVWVAAAITASAMLFVGGVMILDDESTPSIAVLPFVDMSETSDQKYLADGIAEELINQLTRLDGLDVVSRTESFSFRTEGGDLKAIGRQLNVTAILEGSVRRSDKDVRITVQLIDVESGYHLWSQNFDRELRDIFAIQDEIAISVAGALGVQLGVGGVNEFAGAGTRNIDAYEAFLRQDYAKAIQLDPDYAAAWGAEGVRIASTMWDSAPEEAPAIMERARPFVAKAIELDPRSSKAHADFATLSYVDNGWDVAEQYYARALLLRREPYGLGHYANMLMRTGRSTDADSIHAEREAMLRLPKPADFLRINVDIALGRLAKARQMALTRDELRYKFMLLVIALNEGPIEGVRAAIDGMAGTSAGYRELYGPIRDLLDSPDAALAFLEELANDPNRVWPSKLASIALFAAYLGDPEFAFVVFSPELPYTKIRYGVLWFPVMADVRKLPEFKALMTEVRLVDYWRKYGWPDFCWPVGEEDFDCE